MRFPSTFIMIAFLLLFGAFGVLAQDKPAKPEPTKVLVYFSDDRKRIELRPQSIRPIPRKFITDYSSNINTYGLYEIESPDPDKMCQYDRCIKAWDLDSMYPPKCADPNCQKITLTLKEQLPVDKSFLLTVKQFEANGDPAKLTFKVERTAEIGDPIDAYRKGKEFTVDSKLDIQSPKEIKVTRTIYQVTGDTPDNLNAIEVTDTLDASLKKDEPNTLKNRLSYQLDEKLNEGKEYALSISSQIKDSAGQAVEAKGTLKVPGVPSAPSEPKITGTLALDSAVNQKAVFDLTGKFTPLHNLNTRFGRLKPEISVDIGLRSTKSNNSIILNVPFINEFDVKDAKQVSQNTSNISVYAGWRKNGWFRLQGIQYSIGPRAEFDRKFQRINTLGEVRFDFKFYRWQGSIQERRGLITKEPPFGIGEEKGKSLEGINFGFKLTPFLAFDFGGHVNDETLTKNTSTVLVPRHSIVRGYAGFVGAFEWNKLPFPITLTLDESVVYIATPETIGFTTDDGAFLRRIRGFHPHLKTSLDLGFDPSKHYSLSFTYENGRLAPNFEYLNKITAGVKVSY